MDSQLRSITYSVDPQSAKILDTDGLLEHFACRDLFARGEIRFSYWEVDRTILGGAIPIGKPVVVPNIGFLACAYLCERREMGVINLGGAGSIEVDGERFALERTDCLYIGRGAKRIQLESDDSNDPAVFYLLSYPAHCAYPAKLIKASTIDPLVLGSEEEANKRRLYKMICPGVANSCQLVMGFTILEEGCVWNTMPPHTHARRSEVYLYFDVPQESAVMHFMGRPEETRHLTLRNHEAALSPNWSIHCGAGIRRYAFVWGMGGENQDFTDMDHLKVSELR